jgi:hypothetical protein
MGFCVFGGKMNPAEENKLSKLINSSGFPFQLAAENEINKTSQFHSWRIYSREYPWKNPITGTEGYVDLILHSHYETQRMVSI